MLRFYFVGICVKRKTREDLPVFADGNAAAEAAFAVDHLTAVAGLHAGTKAEHAGAFDVAAAFGVMGGHW